MNSISKRTLLTGAVTGLVLGSTGVLVALTGGGAAADAGSTSPQSVSKPAGPVSSTVSSTVSSMATPTRQVETQRGLVLEGSGSLGDLPVSVTIYENSRYGNSVQVVLGDPEDDRIGYTEQSDPFVVDGHLAVTLEVDGQDLTLTGSVTPTGKPSRLVEPVQDNGEQIVSRGTQTQLATDVVASYGGVQGQLSFAPAFAYDLEVQRVTLYGR